MPAGSSERSLYPSLASWRLILDALAEAYPAARFVLVGKTHGTTLDRGEHAALLAHHTEPVDAFDLELAEQLALVQACDVFLAPHTGFGLAALAVGTPWLALSGGRWFEYYFNHVPFRSVIPDVERYPCFSQFAPAATIDDGEDGPRTPSMSRARIRDDLGAIVDGSRRAARRETHLRAGAARLLRCAPSRTRRRRVGDLVDRRRARTVRLIRLVAGDGDVVGWWRER